MTQAIHDFLAERRDNWLKAKLKSVTDEAEIADIEQQAAEKFSLAQWVPDAAKRAGHLSIVSHLGKFTHPSAKTSAVIAQPTSSQDGYWRSGNIDYPLDVFGSAASMDVYKFLNLPLSNGRTVLEDLEAQDGVLQQLFHFPPTDFATLRSCFLCIKKPDQRPKTDHQVKQVYFPVGHNEYHLLSILTPSGLITELKKRIDYLRFSDTTKAAKEKRRKNEWDDTGYADLWDLTVTAYGGTKPQNISVLNNQNAGRAYLLPSMPPQLVRRGIRLPRTDFFKQCLYRPAFQESFQYLHRCMKNNRNNWTIRHEIQDVIRFIIDRVINLALSMRTKQAAGWTDAANRSLPKAQKIWLDQAYTDEREQDDDWRDRIATHLARWFLDAYQDLIRAAYTLGDGELIAVKQAVLAALETDKENF